MNEIKHNKTKPSSYNLFFAIGMLITWFISYYIIVEMTLESAIILSILTAVISLIMPKFTYLIDKKGRLGFVKILIFLLVPSFIFIMGIVSISYFLVGFTGENTLMIALSSYALLLMLIPVKTNNTKKE